jgi:hypothetical protein
VTIVGTESHSFQGEGKTCDGILGWADPDRKNELCGQPPHAEIHTVNLQKFLDEMFKMKEKLMPTKPKYKVGDRVLVETEITEVIEYSMLGGKVVEIDYNLAKVNNRIREENIIGLAPIKEPTKANTVAVVNGYPWILGVENKLWYSPAYSTSRNWKDLLNLGTPKVIWEPENG